MADGTEYQKPKVKKIQATGRLVGVGTRTLYVLMENRR